MNVRVCRYRIGAVLTQKFNMEVVHRRMLLVGVGSNGYMYVCEYEVVIARLWFLNSHGILLLLGTHACKE